MSRKALIASLVLVAGLIASILVVYAFGTPQGTGGSGEPVAAVTPGGLSDVAEQPVTAAAGEVPEPDESVPLAIQIPGCKCHSDDPKLVEEHAKYRMNQCAGCHGGETPTGM